MSNRYLVAYDLHKKSEESYKKVADAIKSCGDAFEVQESVWIVYSDSTRDDVAQTVRTVMSTDDKLIVTFIRGVRHYGIGDKFTKYLSDHPFDSDK